jgi:hypothetical protein
MENWRNLGEMIRPACGHEQPSLTILLRSCVEPCAAHGILNFGRQPMESRPRMAER